MQIREEKQADQLLIHHLTKIAFEPKAFSDGTEPDIIDRLRDNGDLTFSLVAVNNNDLIGHVAFSPVVIGPHTSGWYGLGPISVHPDIQRQGIGSSLINHGLDLLRNLNADGCALIGDPNYSSRFGFLSDGKVQYQDFPTEHVQWLSFGDIKPAGELVFSTAFDG